MASRNFAPARALVRGVTLIHGSCLGAGGMADPTGRIGAGVVAITRTAAGRYLISFRGRYRRLLHFTASVMPGVTGTNAGTTALSRVVNAMKPLNTTLNGVLVTQVEVYINNNTGAEALTDLALNDLLTFEAVFQNSSYKPSQGR